MGDFISTDCFPATQRAFSVSWWSKRWFRDFSPLPEQRYARNWCEFPPSSDSSGGLWQVQGGIIRDLDGLLHGGQKTLASLSPQGGAETLWASDQQFHHHIGIFLHTLTWYTNAAGKRTNIYKVMIKLFTEGQARVSYGAEALGMVSSAFQNDYWIFIQGEPTNISTWVFSSLATEQLHSGRGSWRKKTTSSLCHSKVCWQILGFPPILFSFFYL